jgi:hypothetical protein
LSDPITLACTFIEGVSCYQVAKDFTSPAVALLAAISVICMGVTQFSKQKKLEREARRVEHERDIKIKLFKEVTTLVDQCSAKISQVRSSCLSKHVLKMDFTAEEKINYVADIQTAIIALILKVESHEVIAPQLFKVFRYVLCSESHDINELNKSVNTISPGALWHVSGDITSYIADLQVGLQNLAFSEIFGEKVPYRVPVSDHYKVIENTPDSLIKLEHYFLNETDWGKECNKLEREAFERENFHNQSEINKECDTTT